MMIKRLSFATALMFLLLFSTPITASAYDVFQGACSQGGSTNDINNSAACNSNTANNPIAGPDGLLMHVTNIVSFVAGAAAIIIIIISAIKFITSGSDVSTGSRTDTDVEDARRSIANALIGLIIIVLARTIIYFILKKI